MNHLGAGRFRAFSAGSMPKGAVNPHALPLVRALGFKDEDFRSKPWDEFAAPGAPALDFVITVCDNAAGEVCPVWPGQPMTAHWGIQDPAEATGSPEEQLRAFQRAFRELDARIMNFTSLRLESLDQLSIQRQLDEIGRTRSAAMPVVAPASGRPD